MNVKDKLLELNSAQKNACMCIDGPICVSAGAGAGKTKVLTTRIAYLVSQKINPASILAITFTEGAQKEMRTRLADMLGKDICSQIFIKTFHSVGSCTVRCGFLDSSLLVVSKFFCKEW